MPNHLEHVVRPSQSPEIRPGVPTQIFSTPKVPQNNPTVWGSAGSSVFDLHAQEQVELPQPIFESQRTFDVVRVFNPDDKEQFVDTEQLTEYRGKAKFSNNQLTLKWSINSNTDNTQVMQRGLTKKSS